MVLNTTLSIGLTREVACRLGIAIGMRKTLYSTCLFHTDVKKNLEKHLSQNYEDHQELLYKKPVQPKDPRRLRVGVVGMPNVGKSTLINSLIGCQLLATAKRIDTTRDNTLAILTVDDVQIEFQDTPGIHNKRKAKKITGSLQYSYLPSQSFEQADLAMVVVDLSERKTSSGFLQPEILLHLMKHQNVPSILVMNKIDRLTRKNDVFHLIDCLTAGAIDGRPLPKPNVLKSLTLEPINLPKIESSVFEALDSVKTLSSANDISLANKTESKVLSQLRQCRGWPHFKEVFIISALKGHRVDKLKNYLLTKAISEPWKYHSDVITNASPYDVVKGAMRSSLLENLAEELPYYTDIEISDWQNTDDYLGITIDLICKKQRHERFVENASKLLAFGTKRRLKGIFSVDIKINVVVYTADCL